MLSLIANVHFYLFVDAVELNPVTTMHEMLLVNLKSLCLNIIICLERLSYVILVFYFKYKVIRSKDINDS